MKTNRTCVLISLFALAISANAEAADSPFRVTKDIVYQKVGDRDLHLDLYRPTDAEDPAPLIVWVHGGGWQKGSKDKCPISWLCEHGFAIASIEYRLTGEAQWPSQIQDCRAAVAFLRSRAERFNLAAQRIGASGSSAGGHLVALMGTLDQSETGETGSAVQAVCNFFGPADLLTMPNNVLADGKTEADLAGVPGAKLLGGIVRDRPEKARHASALHQASSGDAPMLIIHGDADEAVPLKQSQRLHKRLKQLGVETSLVVVPGAGHGMRQVDSPELRETVLSFFNRHVGGSHPAETRATNREDASFQHLFVAKLLLRRLSAVDLSEEQESQFNQMSHALRIEIDNRREEVGITKEIIQARDEAYGNAKKSGLKGDVLWKEVQESAGLSDAQRDVFRETQSRYARFRKEVLELLTDRQLAAVPNTKRRNGSKPSPDSSEE